MPVASLCALVLAVSASPSQRPVLDPLPVSIRIDRSAPYLSGDSVRTFVRAPSGTYLTVLRVDTEGRIKVLYPPVPAARGFVSDQASRRLPTTGLPGFRSGPRPGVGYVAAFVSPQPFDFRGITRDSRWDYGPATKGRIVGDPVMGLLLFVTGLSGDFVYDLATYHVGGRHEFPRSACTACHARPASWDPYAARCTWVTVTMTVAQPQSPSFDQRVPAAGRAVRALPHLVYRSAGTGSETQVPATVLRAIVEAQARRPANRDAGAPVSTGKPHLRRRQISGAPNGSETPPAKRPYH
jgi:hypothetical protein